MDGCTNLLLIVMCLYTYYDYNTYDISDVINICKYLTNNHGIK